MATQAIRQQRARNMRVNLVGKRSQFITAKDIALALIAHIGANGAAGHAIEYAGPVIADMEMAERLTLCNMSIEAGARVGLIAPDEKTYDYLRGRPMAPKGELFEQALTYWRTLPSDPDAVFHRDLTFEVSDIEPHVTWGTSPEDAAPISARVPSPEDLIEPMRRERRQRALACMGLLPGDALEDIAIDVVFIGSCTNSRIEDLRAAASIASGRHVAPNVKAIVVPGSGLVREQAEREGLAQTFLDAGFEWREPGCSMCVGMNGDKLEPGQRCASTSNRNFEGRQGVDGRTHLMSPAMAAAAAVTGRLTDVRKLTGAKP
jgi:3-isopropylmalate/(R)-2-methylmalate dehydratase large subunit